MRLSRIVTAALFVIPSAVSADQVTPPTPISGQPVAATPRTDVSTWFPQDAYPLAARQRLEQGIVTVRVEIDATGKVYSCSIVASSGSSALDRKTCELAQARGAFIPAKDANGISVRSANTLPRVRWMLPDGDRGPEDMTTPAPGISAWYAKDYPRDKEITGSTWFRLDDYPKRAKKLGLTGAVGVRVAIATNGLPTICWIVESSGIPDLDEATCAVVLRRGRWVPAKASDGTPVSSAYTLPIVHWALGD